MKYSFRSICFLLTLIILCSILVTASAAADPDALTITKISLSQNESDVILNMTFRNDGETEIDEIGVAAAFFDENGDRIFGYANTLEGRSAEEGDWYYLPEGGIMPGDVFYTEDVFTAYTEATNIGIAIVYYHRINEGYIILPESEWEWLFPGYKASVSETKRTYYTYPPDFLYETIGDFDLGYYNYVLSDYNAAYYGKNQGGDWITQVEAGSPAANAGLEVGDLVIFIDGIKPTENLFAYDLAMAAIVNNEKVEFVFERDGIIYVTQILHP